MGNENCILRMVKEEKITNMCSSTRDSFQEISVQHFSGHGLMGLLLPLSSGMSGKRKDCWMLGKQTEHMDEEQAKSVTRNGPYPFNILALAYSTSPCSLIPKLFRG